MPEGFQGLQLPPVEMKQLSLQFENSGNMFVNAVDRLIQTMESTDFKQQPTIINLSAPITVTAKSESALAQKTGESVLDVLERVTDKATNLTRYR